ncbi:PREDICTED: gametocyte-specific factor 1-like [Papilio polytes]|uniref:gametocyte-specific factor 1-like n=1 Tax=Papilio polytes TaxID=76194 RepID=UPI0006761CAD|nr:PREDICTED: gametocyte-specific factor 1-like [Papilio polytes]XP_013141876.1 PREDICTED: gametocyte-specific factor 1-like [Papilio polytes]XP_013141877.1 PREDICTED: gametocyte-specific factor 1-like [Papilio polytes]XP_013141878.1 PREDICTED: gametocyte-specific factor 1-like [Papilio polytes]
MADPNPHAMMTCPYNPTHQVEKYRLQVHIGKCAKQYSKGTKAICPFDSTHVVNDPELDFHITVCPKRSMLDTQLYITDDDYTPTVGLAAPAPAVPSEENWDEACCVSYNPELKKNPPHVITKLKGATPSERRKKRMEGVKNYKPPQP